MFHRLVSVRVFAVLSILSTGSVIGCDQTEDQTYPADGERGQLIEHEQLSLEVESFDAGDVPWPSIESGDSEELLAQPQIQIIGPWTIETFVFSSNPDFLAISTAPDVLIAPFPVGIAPLAPEIDDGFLLGFQFRDLNGNVIGFGSELEVLDFETLTGDTTYTLMINGRGSIAFSQVEDFESLFGLVDDMVADQVVERVFEPPVVLLSTIPGSTRVLGGSGEFEGVVGVAREYAIVNSLDLVTRNHNLGSILQVAYLSP